MSSNNPKSWEDIPQQQPPSTKADFVTQADSYIRDRAQLDEVMRRAQSGSGKDTASSSDGKAHIGHHLANPGPVVGMEMPAARAREETGREVRSVD